MKHFAWVAAAAWLAGFERPLLAQRGQETIRKGAPTAESGWLSLGAKRFRLGKREDLIALISLADDLIQRSVAQEENLRSRRSETLRSGALRDMTPAELKEYFSEPRDFISKKDRRGLTEIGRLAQAALDEESTERRREHLRLLQEVATALNNNHRFPAPKVIDFLQPPLVWLDYQFNPVARGQTPATNLRDSDSTDSSRNDPEPSSFWSPVYSIRSQDLYHGFGRSELPPLEEKLWEYSGPKTSYGGCPGFEAMSGSVKIRVKFIETTSEPLAARIFAALGYNIDATDHASQLKIRYDRRLIKEFHLRKDMGTRIRAAFAVPVYTIHLQKRYDPFAFIDAAVMKDGTAVSGLELKALLFRDAGRKLPEDVRGNFREDVEQRIDYLLLAAANVQVEDETVRSIGPWDFDRLGHEDRREVRALCLLAAWVGWFDARFENTRLKIVGSGGRRELKHFLTDLGGGLGKSVGTMSRRSESPNQFAWFCTRRPQWQGKGRMTIPFRIVNYEPNEDTLAFEKMTVDDARWMARLIGQLTESQIVEALVASGFDSAQVRIFAEKLISRRDQMIRDLDLTSEFTLLRPHGSNRNFSYNPALEGPVKIKTVQGQQVVAKTANLAIQNGRVVSTSKAAAPPAGSGNFARVR